MTTNYTQADHEEFFARMDKQAAEFRRSLAELERLQTRAMLLVVQIEVANEKLQEILSDHANAA